MKLIFKIARTELRNLFFSPVAWFLTLIFLVICAYFYSYVMGGVATFQDSMQRTVPSFTGFPMGLTNGVYMSMNERGLMGNIFANLYLFIPLLTMGLINREFTSGTVKLLYSSPVKLHQIVWGKYLAVMVYNMLLLTILLLFMVVGGFSIKNADIGHFCTTLTTFYLVVCAYTAIGMFMSSISHYQIVSAIATFTLLFLLQRVGGLWQEHDFIRDLTYFLSINGRTERMVRGLVSTRDVMYYALLTYMFVSFSYLNLRHGRELVSKTKKILRYLTVFFSVMVLGYLTSRPGYIGYWDGTETKMNTITEKTQEILKNMQEEPLEVTLYTNLLDNGFSRSSPTQRNFYVWEFWDKYVRFKANIKFNYVLYYDVMDGDSTHYNRRPGMSLDSIAREVAKIQSTNIDRYLKPAEIRKQIDLQPEGVRPMMLLKYKGKSIVLRTYDDATFWPNEHHVAAALKRLSTDTVPKIYVTTGNLERAIHKIGEREYYGFSINKLNRAALINNGFELDTLNLSHQDIPLDADALVLADPKVVLSDTVTSQLKQYIDKGGNLLIMGEPGKQGVLNPLIEPLGVTLMPGTLVQVTKDETPDKITPFVTKQFAGLLKERNQFSEGVMGFFQQRDTLKELHPGTAALSYTEKGFHVSRLLLTGPREQVWVKSGLLVTDSSAPVMVPSEGDYKLDSFTVALALNRIVNSRDQRIVIVGDADFASNLRAPTHGLIRNYLSWMTNESFPVHVFTIPPTDTLLSASLSAINLQKIFLLWILPVVVLIVGILTLLRRKRQ